MESDSAARVRIYRRVIINRSSQKKLKKTEGKDIISKLPEPLIGSILSFLPTKDAVRTSVLSRRWINLWTSLTNFNLDDTVFYNRKSVGKKKTAGKLHFINFVNRVLILTNGSTMQTVSLVITNKYEASLLNTWISSFLIRRVKNLCISMNSEFPFSALTSYYLFESDSLEELVLEMCCSPIKVPPCISGVWFVFHKLKLLKLCGIICSFDSSLRLYLPNLKKFETKNCSWVSARGRNVTVNAPLLESIFIKHNFESLSREPRSCAVHFDATQLKEFSYSGDGGISQSIILLSPLLARNASANIILKQRQNSVPETGSCALLLLQQFSQVKRIKFDGSKGISKFDQEFLNSSAVPECLTSSLQIVKFENVSGCEHELYLAKLFLENGTVLERMSFSFAWGGKSKVMEEFKEKLFSFKKSFSSFAIVEFSYNYDDYNYYY